MSETRGKIDWQEVHVRLEQERRAVEATERLSLEEASRILKERARALARPVEEAVTQAEGLELLVFSVGAERYGIETDHVLEVIPLRELTPVPCTPASILGVVNHRGRILPVLDLRRLFDLGDQGVAEGSRVVAVEARGMTFGIFAGAVTGTVRIGVEEVAPSPATSAADRQGLIRGVTGEMVAVLDLDALSRDPRITVNEEVN